MKKLLSVFVFLATFGSAQAFAGTHLTVYGGVSYGSTKVEPADSFTYGSKLGFGGGLGVTTHLGSQVDLEIDALYVQRKISADAAPDTLTLTTAAVQVPVLVRFNLGSMVSFGVGGYYAQSMGDVKAEGTVGGVSFSTSAPNTGTKGDYGLIGSVGFAFPMGSTTLLVDGRYAMGLKDMDSAADSKQTFKDIQGFVGVRFGGK